MEIHSLDWLGFIFFYINGTSQYEVAQSFGG